MKDLLGWKTDEIENYYAQDRGQRLDRVYLSEIAAGNALADELSQPGIKGLVVTLKDAAQSGRQCAAGSAHQLVLHQPRIHRRAGNVVEMRFHVRQQPGPRRQARGVQHLQDALRQPRIDLLQGSAVEAFFVLVIVVEQRLVDAGAAGDLISAGAGYALARELFQGGVEDRRAGLFR